MSISKNEEYKRCQSRFWNLAKWTEAEMKDDPRGYLHLYMETARCDKFFNLSHERENYKNFFMKRGFVDRKGKTPIDKILKFDELNLKENRCLEHAVNNYRRWNHKAVINSLSWSNYLHYHIWEKYERFGALVIPLVIPTTAGVGRYFLTRRVSKK